VVIDITTAASPTTVGSVGTLGPALGVAVSGSYLYVVEQNTGLQVIDISNPASPIIVGNLDTPGYAIRVAVSGSLAYVADGESGLQVVDITNPASPAIVGNVVIPSFAYGVAVSESYAYVAGFSSGLQVIDITAAASPTIVGSVNTPGSANAVAVFGSNAYVTSSSGGLTILSSQCSASVGVFLSSFQASPQPGAIFLEWATSLDSDVSGFYVERSRQATGEYMRVSDGMIPPPSPYRFSDYDVTPGMTYFYRLEAVDRTGGREFFGPISARTIEGAVRPTLGQAFPNPLTNGSSTIPFVMSRSGPVTLRVLDLAGREVRLLLDKQMEAGVQSAFWDGRDNQGRLAPAGMYLYEIHAPGFESARKLVRLR